MRVLITSGPTAVAIDDVRFITNAAKGEIGALFADYFLKKQAGVFLLSSSVDKLKGLGCCVEAFCFFQELEDKLKKAIGQGPWDLVVHSAAVSDFAPEKTVMGKISSDGPLTLRLKPLPKLIGLINESQNVRQIVAFKLEPDLGAAVKQAMNMFEKYDKIKFIVANSTNPYKAKVCYRNGAMSTLFTDKQSVARYLVDVIMEGL